MTKKTEGTDEQTDLPDAHCPVSRRVSACGMLVPVQDRDHRDPERNADRPAPRSPCLLRASVRGSDGCGADLHLYGDPDNGLRRRLRDRDLPDGKLGRNRRLLQRGTYGHDWRGYPDPIRSRLPYTAVHRGLSDPRKPLSDGDGARPRKRDPRRTVSGENSKSNLPGRNEGQRLGPGSFLL